MSRTKILLGIAWALAFVTLALAAAPRFWYDGTAGLFKITRALAFYDTSSTPVARMAVSGSAANARGEFLVGAQPLIGLGPNTIDYPRDRHVGTVSLPSTGSPTYVIAGTQLPTNVGTPLEVVNFAFNFNTFTSTAANGTDHVGWEGPYTLAKPGIRPKLVVKFGIGGAITNVRYWIGLASASTVATVVNSDVASPIFEALGFESGVNSGKWMCCSGDGTNSSCTDMGVTAAVNDSYIATVDWSVLGTLVCRLDTIDGTTGLVTASATPVLKTSHLGTANTAQGFQVSVTEKTTATRAINIGHAKIETN